MNEVAEKNKTALLQELTAAKKQVEDRTKDLHQIADRFSVLATDLKRHLDRDPAVKLDGDLKLSASLKFGPDSGVDSNGITNLIIERDRLVVRIANIRDALRKLHDIDPDQII